MTDEDLAEIEQAGRRCAVCQTGRRWRRLQVVRSDGADPVVLCAACHARFGDTPPIKEALKAEPEVAPARDTTPRPPRVRNREDRLKKALRELPRGEHSTGRIAKAAGLNHAKALSRLHALEAAGEIQQVGKRWSTERPSTDIEAAFDRLQAKTGNLRIVRKRAPDG